nr:immunoglobulin light chain junction region [Macaca mulatta]MOV61457.1 immunoglobulin light chain junction region [Macaca mulatta]MOV62100.1 immunoglobulin light chain junction region [Macaca mulatta]MOV62364.1 immunoglobulin light chain junction region [Macaca mulatta]MOV63188.1 immunoglobulin light chain junction region [Macaca mulatta]
CLQTKSCPRTL